jgi:hypothetical protein
MAVIVPVVLAGGASGQGELVITDLVGPRGLSQNGTYMLIAEQGTGRVLQVTKQGTVSVRAEGLPSSTFLEDGVPVPTGVTSAIDVGGKLYVTVGESRGEAGFDHIYSVVPGQAPVIVADLLAYEQANNVDGNVDMAGEPELLINAYDLVSDNAGGFYVSVSGGNTILHVAADGTISPFAIFPNRENPLFPAVGGPTMQQVPTGLEWGPDGALYVTTLTGFPFPEEGARVYRMVDSDGDGDALEDGETTVYASGLTTATNLVFDSDGSLLVTEFRGFLRGDETPGRLVRVSGGAITEVIAEPLLSPTGVTIFDGEIIVTQEFLGIVSEAEAGAAIFASLRPPAEGGEITPPSTGDGGLAGGAAPPTALLLAAALVVATAVGARTLVGVRR